tara:strand:- start:1070 stop:1294 length:225 start_codon:yes stop_codon:yes gene_type:complete
MNQISPLNLTKEISVMDKAIASLLEMGKPKPKTRFWAKVAILKARRQQMHEGTGFSGSYSHVSDKEADKYIAAH